MVTSSKKISSVSSSVLHNPLKTPTAPGNKSHFQSPNSHTSVHAQGCMGSQLNTPNSIIVSPQANSFVNHNPTVKVPPITALSKTLARKAKHSTQNSNSNFHHATKNMFGGSFGALSSSNRSQNLNLTHAVKQKSPQSSQHQSNTVHNRMTTWQSENAFSFSEASMTHSQGAHKHG